MVSVANLGSLMRPASVSVWTKDPQSIGKFVAFLISRVNIPSPSRFLFDITESENHGRSYRVTRNPVEGIASDNVIRNPDTLTVTGFLSANLLGSPIEVALGGLGSFMRRDRKELENLRRIADLRNPVVVWTPERTYPSMIIESISEHYDKSTGNGAGVTVQFVEVRVLTPGLVVSLDPADAAIGAATSAGMGSQAPTSTPDPGGP